ncbi:MAG: mechanosensitive ion channel family protein [Chloroflexi bacterium]|nr:mechanosensitive ion channel family protein [Chloroflexota bacterium]
MLFLEAVLYDNTILRWLIASSIALVVLAALQIAKRAVFRRAANLVQRNHASVEDFIAGLFATNLTLFNLLVSVYIASLALNLPPDVREFMNRALIIGFIAQGAVWGNRLISAWVNRYRRDRLETDATGATTINAIGLLARLTLWTIILLFALANLGVNITALVAGLGVSSVAVALALQNILGDLFASLSIALDKPFVIGDFINLDGGYMGSVEHIGLKTTRVRSLSGEQIIISNNDLLKSRIRNYKRLQERRVVISISVVYQTPHEKLVAIPEMVKEIVTAQENVRFERAHFKEISGYALNFEAVYQVLTPDYNIYMDCQQAINLALHQRFQQQGIDFAYPTQMMYVTDARV